MSPTLVLFILVIVLVIILMYQRRKRIKQNELINANIHLYAAEEFPLNVYFNKRTQASPKFNILVDAVREAISQFNTTVGYTMFVMNENVFRYPNIVMIQMACGSHKGCISEFDGKGGVLAHATFPPFRRVCIDCSDMDYKPLHLVIMHEFGHIIGMEHTTSSYKGQSLMHPYISTRVHGLTEYDVKRIERMYPFLK